MVGCRVEGHRPAPRDKDPEGRRGSRVDLRRHTRPDGRDALARRRIGLTERDADRQARTTGVRRGRDGGTRPQVDRRRREHPGAGVD